MSPAKLYFVNLFLRIIPETNFFGFKRKLFRMCGAEIGNNVRICSSVKVVGCGNLSIGDNTWIGPECLLSVSSNIKIGPNCDFAPRVYLGNGTHEITPDRDRIAAIETCKDIIIGEGSWICVNSTILPGVKIGKKCVIAAGAIVTKSIDDYCLVGGIPAKVIKKLDTNTKN